MDTKKYRVKSHASELWEKQDGSPITKRGRIALLVLHLKLNSSPSPIILPYYSARRCLTDQFFG
jgi:hypothetical protein